MKSDTTRRTHDRTKSYSGLVTQQGRVMLDADWNEGDAIRKYFERSAIRDTIGLAGTPISPALPIGGFVVSFSGSNLRIGAGHYYVDGILCENDSTINFQNQPVFPLAPDPEATVPTTGKFLVYLDVYEQFISCWDDENLSDPALGGREISGRTKIIWRARLLSVTNPAATCASEFARVLDTSNGTLASIAKAPVNTALCAPRADSSFRRTENQLYRVEVHAGGTLTSATFKWSRENGSVVSTGAVTGAKQITVDQIGRDQRLSFASGNWVEVTDLRRELLGKSGNLFEIDTINGNDIVLKTTITAADYDAVTMKVRRWESVGAQTIAAWKGASTDQPVASGAPGFGTYVQLEDGVWVRMSGSTFNEGDHWEIPARTITGDVMWPKDSSGNPVLFSKAGILHSFAPLAIVDFATKVIVDCRKPYAKLNADLQMFYLGGDGQTASPIPSVPNSLTLPQDLVVGVCRGMLPVAGARIQVLVTTGTGTLSLATPLVTGADGIARVRWTLDGINRVQKVTAHLLDENLVPIHLPVEFTATLNVAAAVAYTPQQNCTPLAGVDDVQEALDKLCELAMRPAGGGRPCCVSVGVDADFATLEEAFKAFKGKKLPTICICLRPGVHDVGPETLSAFKGQSDFSAIDLHGVRSHSIVRSKDTLEISGLKWVSLRDFQLVSVVEVALSGSDLTEIEMIGLTIDQTSPKDTLVNAAFKDTKILRISECTFKESKSVGIVLLRDPKILEASIERNTTKLAEAIKEVVAKQGAQIFEPERPVRGRTDVSRVEADSFTESDDMTLKLRQLVVTGKPTKRDFLEIARMLMEFIGTRPGTFAPAGAADKKKSVASICLIQNNERVYLEENFFGLPIVLYGTIDGAIVGENIREQVKGQKWRGRGGLWCNSNIIPKLTISNPPAGFQSFEEWLKNDGERIVFSEIKLTDNYFGREDNVTAAQHTAITGNSFSGKGIAETVLGETGSAYGNHSSDGSKLFFAVNQPAGTTKDNPGITVV